jgi:hypothetical protein
VLVSKRENRYFIVLVSIALFLSSCFKKDVKISLPPKTGSSFVQARMGNNYDTTLYINLGTGNVVGSHLSTAWDLRFDASDDGFVVLMNSGNNNTRIIKSTSTDITSGITIPSIDSAWGFDAPSRWVDSAYMRNWRNADGSAKPEVYIVRQGGSLQNMKYYKLQMKSVNKDGYSILVDTIFGNKPKQIFVPKNRNKNFVYFSFKNGGEAKDIEPERTAWDIVLMPYNEPFYHITPFLYYPVTGVLTNSYNTYSAGDTMRSTNFSKFTLDSIGAYPLNHFHNTIGYSWKKPDANFNYITDPSLLYLVKTQQGALYKLHFLDFYYQGTEKGSPKMEWERLQ